MRSRPAQPKSTEARLLEIQGFMGRAILRRLDRNQRIQRKWLDGRPMKDVAAAIIKPNARLSSLERLEIYNRQYWFRVLDCLYDDYPGLRAVLGERKFHKLCVAYLSEYPSASFTLRNIGSRLEAFLLDQPDHAHPEQAISLDMARFEWAQIVAFDGPERPALTADDLLGKSLARLRLGLQPYLTLMEMQYPLDEFILAVKKRNATLRNEASNASEERHAAGLGPRVRLPRRRRVFVAVHRFDNDLYYKRLTEPQFRLLESLRAGATLQQACGGIQTARGGLDPAGQIQSWFQTWMQLGWFCKAE